MEKAVERRAIDVFSSSDGNKNNTISGGGANGNPVTQQID